MYTYLELLSWRYRYQARMTRKRPKKSEASKDFPKKKQKVGQGKRPAENETVVSFKSGSVVIPSQLERTREPTTHRKLSLQVIVCWSRVHVGRLIC